MRVGDRKPAPLRLAAIRRWPTAVVLCLTLLVAAPLAVASPPASATVAEADDVLEVFVRDGCPHCSAAKTFLPAFTAARPGLRVVLRSLDDEVTARAELEQLTRDAGLWPPGVPTFVIGGRVMVGFADAARSGPQLAALVDQRARPWGSVETEHFGTLSVARLGLPLFTLALGLLDGFNPCAMWVLLFLLSLLLHLHDRQRMALVASTFVLASGAVYYAFMAAWLNVFLLLGLSTPLRWTLGAVALAFGAVNLRDFFRPDHGFTLAIPDAAKPGLYARVRAILAANTLLPALFGVAALAVVVNFIELLCTAGLPALYTAILAAQGLSSAAYYAYLGLYIVGYVADDTLMVTVAVVTLRHHKLSARAGGWLKLLSGIVMLALGGILLLRPEWLQ